MSVLSVAQSNGSATEGSPSGDQSSQSSTSSESDGSSGGADGKTIKLAERIDNILSDFITGMIPGEYTVEIDWGLISNIAGAISGGSALYFALSQRL